MKNDRTSLLQEPVFWGLISTLVIFGVIMWYCLHHDHLLDSELRHVHFNYVDVTNDAPCDRAQIHIDPKDYLLDCNIRFVTNEETKLERMVVFVGTNFVKQPKVYGYAGAWVIFCDR